MSKFEPIFTDNGWCTLQEADAEKHVLEIMCRTENGVVMEVRFRHNDGEEQSGTVTLNGENVLPMPLKDFKKAFKKKKLEIK